MKKLIYFLAVLILIVNNAGCSGYNPIYSKDKIEFYIAGFEINGNKKIGKQIYSRLNNSSSRSENKSEKKNIYIAINVSKNKVPTVKDGAGKILEYKINLNTSIEVKDFLTKDEIFTQTFSLSSSYRVQEQYSETMKLENKSIENLLDKTYQDILLQLSRNIITKL